MTQVEPVKTAGFVDSRSNQRNRKRIEEDERELEELMGQNSPAPEEATEVEQEEPAVTEEEPKDPEEKSFKKRYGDLRRHMSEKEKEWESKFEELRASTENKNIVPPKTDEDIEAWSRKYPDVAGIVETIAQKKASEMVEGFKARFEKLDEIEKETTRKTAEQKIREAHSDFDSLRKSEDFHKWADQQPKWVQDALYENEDDPASVIRVLDLFKMDNGLTPSARKQKTKEAASMIKPGAKTKPDQTHGGGTFLESQVEKMTSHEYAANEEAIMQAIRNGKFVYDLSGGAR